MSAASVIHSLIFQLAQTDPNLQDMVLSADRNSLKTDLSSAITLLTNLINFLGSVRIIIDGLDEIGSGMLRLLGQILTISKHCEGARVLISSRPEADIKAMLNKASIPIRVDDRNTPSIKTFVHSRLDEWVQGRVFTPEEREELTRLVDGIAKKAKGMIKPQN
jgi:hypothetical protein